MPITDVRRLTVPMQVPLREYSFLVFVVRLESGPLMDCTRSRPDRVDDDDVLATRRGVPYEESTRLERCP